jgi:hypothetical protein
MPGQIEENQYNFSIVGVVAGSQTEHRAEIQKRYCLVQFARPRSNTK